MNPALPFFSFECLHTRDGFLHGTSPRCYHPAPGASEAFDPVSGLSSGECSGHARIYLETLGMGPRPVHRLRQVHGDRVVVVGEGETPEGLEGDALITAQPDCAIGVLTADCVPVVLCDPATRSVGVVHAGRLGTQKSILQKTIGKMQAVFGVRPETLWVGLGPAIGPCCYEVEETCAALFKNDLSDGASFVRPHAPGKALLDLWGANRSQARAAGVPPSQTVCSEQCTVCNKDRWYSYRREGRGAGRMFTVAMWKG